MSRITIRTENKKFPVAPNLYGIFFEDINRAGDGGLYPEMLRNRSFEDSIEPKDCHTEQDGYANTGRPPFPLFLKRTENYIIQALTGFP